MSSVPFPQSARGSFFDALAIQSRVIGALILRELHTRYGRENVGYLWLVGEPMMLATVIGLLHSASSHAGHGGDMKALPFAVLGYTVFILFRGIVNRSEGSLEANAPLLYHRQVTILDITIARALLEFAGVFLTFVILMTLIICLRLANPPVRPLALLAAWGLMFWYSFGHSLVITAISYENRTIGRLVHPYSYFMVGLSGAFIPLAWLPHPYRDWLSYLPITSIFELARYGQFSAAKLDYFYGEYLVAACAILTWTGLVCVRTLRHKLHLG
ncbi:MAG: ABC transporter permease [Methylobacteriaceae bacterium]|nr:ABC transporter permease [Methylobacteriaceae bacterium]